MKADVAVVGGGPAGSATALLLARRGFEVVLFDRAAFPRNKPCGEFLNPGAVRLMRSELDVRVPDDAEPIESVSIVPEKGDPVHVPLVDNSGSSETGYSLRRIRTDSLLLEAAVAAGVRVYENSRVRSGLEGVHGDDFRCQARLVIAADGTHSILARERRLSIPIPRLQRIGLIAHFRNVQGDEERSVRMFAARRRVPGVTGYSFQTGSRAVLSAVLPKSSAADLRLNRTEFVEAMARGLGLPEGEIEAIQTTACFGHRLRRPWDDGILFVGDACRFVDPFTGEGVHHALQGAIAAVEATAEHLHHGSPLSQYVELRRSLDRRYVVCDVIQALVHRPAMLNFIAANLRKRPQAAQRLIAEVVDLLPPGGILSPRMFAEALMPRLT